MKDPPDQGERARQASASQIAVQPLGRDFPRHPPRGQHGPDFTGKDQLSVRPDRRIERLHPERVAAQPYLAALCLEEGESEHPAELREGLHSLACQSFQQDLCVTAGPESMADFLQPGKKGAVIVDLTVEYEMPLPVRGGHRLTATGAQVKNAQPSVHQPPTGFRVEQDSTVVRSAVPEGFLHGQQGAFQLLRPLFPPANASDSAHKLVS